MVEEKDTLIQNLTSKMFACGVRTNYVQKLQVWETATWKPENIGSV